MAFAKEHLKSVIDRIERLESEKKDLGEDIKEVYAEAKGNGFDTKILKAVIKLRKVAPADREQTEAMVDLYLSALADAPAAV